MNNAYIAGFFDGEGSISVSKSPAVRTGKLYYSQMNVTLAQKRRRVIGDCLASYLGGAPIQVQRSRGLHQIRASTIGEAG